MSQAYSCTRPTLQKLSRTKLASPETLKPCCLVAVEQGMQGPHIACWPKTHRITAAKLQGSRGCRVTIIQLNIGLLYSGGGRHALVSVRL
jgi:hypothetical protein